MRDRACDRLQPHAVFTSQAPAPPASVREVTLHSRHPLPPKPLPGRVRRLIRGAQARLAWERFAPAWLAAALAVLVFLAGAWAGVWERIGDPWRGLALLAAIATIGWTAWRARGLKLPTRSAAKRRLEADNDLPHRPLDALEDSPATHERGWSRFVARQEAATRDLRGARRRPVLHPYDRFYLRFGVPALAALAFAVGYGDNAERVRQSLLPVWQSGVDASDASFEAWVDPPDYTGRRPVTLSADAQDNIPEGSEFVARVSGVRSLPRMRLVTPDGSRRLTAKRLGPESFEVRTVLDEPATASLRLGSRRQVWDLDVVADRPPAVSFADTPEADKRDRLALTYDLDDDYGVESLSLELVPLVDEGEAPTAPDRADIPLRGAPVASADDASQPIDLSRHRWAGRKARGVLVATDGAGHVARSEPAYFTIPDKIFVEPLAKAVVEQRALVLEGLLAGEYGPEQSDPTRPYFSTWEPERRLARAPEQLRHAALLIDAVTEMPDETFTDPAVYMGLRNAASRLRYAREAGALESLPDDLWGVALRAEFGKLGTALEDMRRAQEALNAAIARRAPQREIDTLFDRYNEAVDRYIETLSENAEEADDVAQPGGGQGRSVDEIQELLDAIEEANRIGDTEGARIALARLAELLENMRIQRQQGGGGGGQGGQPGGEMSEEMRESLEDLAELLGEQRDLRDDTEQAEAAEREGGQSGGEQGEDDGEAQGPGEEDGDGEDGSGTSPGELADRQDELQDGLGTLQELLPESEVGGEAGQEAGEALGEARQFMEIAEDALANGNFGEAQAAQDEAIARLRQAGRGLAEALAAERDDQQSAQGNRNPLGQTDEAGEMGDRDQDIDSRSPAERSREILEELRRRAAEQDRSREERDYLERLMKRF